MLIRLQYPYIKSHENVLTCPYISSFFPPSSKKKLQVGASHSRHVLFSILKSSFIWTRTSFTISRLELKTLLLYFGFLWKNLPGKQQKNHTLRLTHPSWGLGNHFCRKVCHGFLISRGKPLGLFNLGEFQATFEGLSWATKKKNGVV